MDEERWFERWERRLDTLGLTLMEWWAWPAAMVALGAATLMVSWLYMPGPGEQVTVFGHPAFGPCPVLQQTGLPCGQCGMTRAWVWAARGDWPLAIRYNPAGFFAWLGLVSGGLLGIVRLLRREGALWRFHWTTCLGLLAGWGLLYITSYELRLRGYNPLP